MDRSFHRKSVDSERANALSHRGHSKAYHSFFEGYAEYKETDAKGKTRIRRVYTAPYHVMDATPGKRRGIKLVQSVFFLAAAVLFCISGVSSFSVNYLWLVNVLQAISFVFIVLTGKAILNCLVMSKMTIHEYRVGPTALRSYSKWAAIAVLVTTIAMIISYLCIHLKEEWLIEYNQELVVLICMAISAAFLFLLYYVEINQTYCTVENKNRVVNSAAVVIQK